MKSKQFVSLIPARKNSKGLPNKNLHPLNGKPLISWTIDASRVSSSIESTFVSSDSNTILQLASDQEAIQIKRDDMLATDNVRMELVVLDAIKKINVISGGQAKKIKVLVHIAHKTDQTSKIMNFPPIDHDSAIS